LFVFGLLVVFQDRKNTKKMATNLCLVSSQGKDGVNCVERERERERELGFDDADDADDELACVPVKPFVLNHSLKDKTLV
jgi:hypothetical protein